jgi:hypothetical protein
MEHVWLAIYLTVASLALLQAVLVVLQIWENRRFARGRLESLRRRRPEGRVALLVPCKGVDEGLEENLRTLLRQDYGNYEVTFVLESANDPAYDVVRRVTAMHPQVDWGIVLAGKAETTGQKVHNLLVATSQLPDDVEYLAFADSDARPHHYWLRGLVSQLNLERTDAATGYRWFVPTQASLANYVLYGINCSYASLFGKHISRYVWGGSWAIRRETFEKLGIREAWQGTLSDDLVVSRVLRRAGLRVEFEPACMVASPLDNSARETFSFVRRQYLIAKHYVPAGWLSALFFVSLANLAMLGSLVAIVWAWRSGVMSPWVPASVCAALYLASAVRGAIRGDLARTYFPGLRNALRRSQRFDLWAGPLCGLIHWLALASSILGSRITWRGITYRIGLGGKIRSIRRHDPVVPIEPQPAGESVVRGPTTRPLNAYRKAG